MGSISKIVAFYSEPPRFEISNGIVNIRLRSGGDVTEMAMPVCTFIRAIDRSQRAIKRYTAGAESVIIDD
jgi:hypothetical protein